MKPKVLATFIALLGFLCGWICACIILQRQFAQRQAHWREESRYDIKQWQDKVKSLRQRIYEGNYREGASPVVEAQRAAFTPSKSAECITLSYVGGLGNIDYHLNLYGNGTLYSEVRGKRQLISMIAHDHCKSFFHRVLASGILHYSERVVALKEDLLTPNTLKGVTDRPNTKIYIFVPELQVEQAISVYAPDVELENFPDIIEFELITQIEKEILELVPKGYPLWK